LDVGLYFDVRNRGQSETSTRLHHEVLEMCTAAESFGAASVWFSEHHLFDDEYLSQPLTFAAAVAARTKRLRIGTAVTLATLHLPVEIAEQAALVDVLSGGRLELGLGAGYRVPEYELYATSAQRRFTTTDTCAVDIARLWSRVTPKPVQETAPIWMGYQGPKGARRAGKLGQGLLTADARSWRPYREGLIEGGHDPAVGRMGGLVQAWVTDDPERDWPRVAPYVAYQLNSYMRHMVEGTGHPAPPPVDASRMRSGDSHGIFGPFWMDTPEKVARKILELTAGAPVRTVFLWASIGGMPTELTMQHIETVSTKLAPLLSGAQPARN
jgi:alkanesulfonate monooxygenase SsuD/methylene tetrahydromethanopterin reductase-like flavin-dependent oxidoreductase (luciferase family)